jgi:hypothetical protein
MYSHFCEMKSYFSYFIFHLYAKVGHSIRWNALHKFFVYIDQHPGNHCVLFIELFTNRHVSAIKKNNYSIFISIVAIWLWGLRNNYLFYNLLHFLKFVLYWFPTKNLDRSWTIGQTGRIVFSAEDYTNMSYYNCCGIRPKHSNISKRVGEGVFTICVVLQCLKWGQRFGWPEMFFLGR